MVVPAYDYCQHCHQHLHGLDCWFRLIVRLLAANAAAAVVAHADDAGYDWPPLWLIGRRLDVRFVDSAMAMSAIASAWPSTHHWDPNAAAVDVVAPVAEPHHGHHDWWQMDTTVYSSRAADYADDPDPPTRMGCARQCRSMRSDNAASAWALQKVLLCCRQCPPARPPHCRSCQGKQGELTKVFTYMKYNHLHILASSRIVGRKLIGIVGDTVAHIGIIVDHAIVVL